ncbi:MAG: T9SS type A sorting domain-containing protein [Bacteroidota bacterium]|jgi:hypothetical protein
MNRRISIFLLALVTSVIVSVDASAQSYVLLGWNDLGMHCSNKDFSKIAVLPPYNNIHAQLVMKSQDGADLVTNGYTVSYSIPGNTYSVGKTNFWTYAQQLFSLPAPLTPNIGLTGNGLTGNLQINGNGFLATGIPVTPFQDTNLVKEKPYQLIRLVARSAATSAILATTDVVIPVSNEISCVKSGCHNSEQAILNSHDEVDGKFNRNGPVLCASCHASNALGTTGMAEAKSLSYRIHKEHADKLDKLGKSKSSKLAVCYNCHPGPNTKCYRDVMLTDAQKVCQDCHGNMAKVASTIQENGRRPWLDEPKCGTCHTTKYAEEPGKLYRESKGHGGLYCSSCHGSPHAIVPTTQANDNLQNLRLQGFAGTLTTCTVCHPSKPAGAGPHGVMYKEDGTSTVPSGYELGDIYPNPLSSAMNSSAVIDFRLPEDSYVTLLIHDASGRQVASLLDGKQSAGLHTETIDLSALHPGIYLYTLRTGAFSATKKLVVLR